MAGGAFIVLFCATGSSYYAFPVFFDALMREMEWSRGQTGAALSIGMFVIGIVSLAIGGIIRKAGVKKVMVFGSVLAATGFALLSTVSALWQLYVYYGLVLSVGLAGIFVIPNFTAVQSWFVEKRGMALGIASTGIGVGGLVMAPIAGWLISLYDWQTAFLFMAGIVALLGVSVSGFIMRTKEEDKSTHTVGRRGVNDSGILSMDGFSLSQAIRQRTFWFISIGWMLWAWAVSVGFTHQVAFAVDMGIERTVAAGAVGLLSAISIPSRLIFGRLGDAIDKRFLFMLSSSLLVAALIVLLHTTNVLMLYVYSLLLGASVGANGPIMPDLIADYFGTTYFGVIYAASFFVHITGTVIGPIFGGWIFDTTGTYSLAFIVSIVLSLVAIIAVYLAGRRNRISV